MLNAERSAPDEGSQLLILRVTAADGDRCAALLRQMQRQAAGASGYQSCDVIALPAGPGPEFLVLARFASNDRLAAWQRTPAFLTTMADVAALNGATLAVQDPDPTGIWGVPAGSPPIPARPPRLWKRWLISLLAVYPALILLVHLLAPLTRPLPPSLGLLIVALVLTGLTTAWILPALNRWLQPWLHRH